ncbi:MAG: hypothetical protein AKCLJLPJ_02065 [Fimbriimonadales bacterium]|nr:MAG: DUF2092 domain-containing protein [Armatimonadota bacterium]MBV6503970.1 hypothetical protein [Fimbriimonadales bacterium]MCE7900043.1 DUF2092 domain-containing protein [Armatimonadetes bacterium ATM1]MDL1929110.1 DUF2092 domain-containing protein [Fimbriimonadia bacterium ATM]MBC6968914.1 DUF2092 domain-containing protein [Armatimonadota bacterium]
MTTILAAVVALAGVQGATAPDLLAKHVASLQKAKALSVDFTVRKIPAAEQHYSLKFSRDGMIRIETPASVLVTDGKTIWEYFADSNEYTERPGGVKDVLDRLSKDDVAAWAAFFIADQFKSAKNVTLGAKRNVSGVATSEVKFTADAKGKTVSLYIDTKTGLARAASFSIPGANGPQEVLVLSKDLQVDGSFAEGAFTFNAPAGAKKVEYSPAEAGKWYESLEEGLKVAKATNRMVFVDFGAVW